MLNKKQIFTNSVKIKFAHTCIASILRYLVKMLLVLLCVAFVYIGLVCVTAVSVLHPIRHVDMKGITPFRNKFRRRGHAFEGSLADFYQQRPIFISKDSIPVSIME